MADTAGKVAGSVGPKKSRKDTPKTDVQILKSFEGRLLKIEADLADVPEATKAWVQDYLNRKYGWFAKAK